MKILVGIFIGIFAVFMSIVFVGGFIQEHATESNTVTPTQRKPGSSPQTYTVSEVATHNSLNDCWLIVNNNVYDVTTFLGQHPGGASTISPYCGQEATRAFDTQDRGPRGGHSSSATAMLADYLIGTIR